MKIKNRYVIIFLILVIIASFIFSMITIISPRELTLTRMAVIELRINKYFSRHGFTPKNLEYMPKEISKDNSALDGWGNEIHYNVENLKVILISYGKDGIKGGQKENTDILYSFRLPSSSESEFESLLGK